LNCSYDIIHNGNKIFIDNFDTSDKFIKPHTADKPFRSKNNLDKFSDDFDTHKEGEHK